MLLSRKEKEKKKIDYVPTKKEGKIKTRTHVREIKNQDRGMDGGEETLRARV